MRYSVSISQSSASSFFTFLHRTLPITWISPLTKLSTQVVFNKQLQLWLLVHLISGRSFFVNSPKHLFPLLHKKCFQSHEPLRSQAPWEAMFVLTARRNKCLPKKKKKTENRVNNGSWTRKRDKSNYLSNSTRYLIYLSCYNRTMKEYAKASHALIGQWFLFKLNLPANY